MREEVSLASLSWYVLLRRGYVSWQFDEQAREVTPFGLRVHRPSPDARAGDGGGHGGGAQVQATVLVADVADVLCLYRDRKCCLRCRRHDAVIGQKATVLPVQLAVRTRTPSPTESGAAASFGAAATTAPAPPRAPGGPTPGNTGRARASAARLVSLRRPAAECTDRGALVAVAPVAVTRPGAPELKGTPERRRRSARRSWLGAEHTGKALVADKAPLAGEEFAADEARIALAPIALAGKLVALAAVALALGVSVARAAAGGGGPTDRRARSRCARGKDFTSMLSNLSDFPQLRVSTGSLGKSFSSPDGGSARSAARTTSVQAAAPRPPRRVGHRGAGARGELFKFVGRLRQVRDPSLEA